MKERLCGNCEYAGCALDQGHCKDCWLTNEKPNFVETREAYTFMLDEFCIGREPQFISNNFVFGKQEDNEMANIQSLIKDVIFNDPATIVLWKDGSKTVVKAKDEKFDPEKGLAMAISKRVMGDKGNYYETFKKWLPEKKEESDKWEAK